MPITERKFIRYMKKIFLTGLRGSGKSTVGKALAAALDLPFVDLDEYLTEREGRSIAEIVAKSGWPAFRKLEKACLAEVCAGISGPAIISTGGGIVLDPANRDFMRERGTVFWLAVDPETATARLEANPVPDQRPAFTDQSLLEEMRGLATSRAPHYHAAAHRVVDGGENVEKICALMLQLLEEE